MELHRATLEGVVVLVPRRFADERGYFSETWNQKLLQDAGIDCQFVQDNQSFSRHPGTIRGLHYQSPPHAQSKLVRVSKGSIVDVAVDVRRGSPTYGRWVSEIISAENGRQLLVPKGFLHGFATLEPDCEVIYKVTEHYAQDCDGTVRFDDPDLNIDWQLGANKPVLSNKDANAGLFADFQSPFVFEQQQ